MCAAIGVIINDDDSSKRVMLSQRTTREVVYFCNLHPDDVTRYAK